MTIFIYPNPEKPHSMESTKHAVELLRDKGCKILVSDDAKALKLDGVSFVTDVSEGVKTADIIVTIGGDGTILHMAPLAAAFKKMLLGVNCGRLGFMASLEMEDLPSIVNLVSGDYKTESRMMLDCVIERKDGSREKVSALNDIVITHGLNYNINDYTVIADGVTVSSLRADGLIFSTPTGASAYSLSAGGPLIEPSMDCIEFTQICPHSLFARSMIFAPDKLLEIRCKAEGVIGLSSDGNDAIPVSSYDRIYIKKSALRLDLIDINGNNYFKSISSKLMQPAKQI